MTTKTSRRELTPEERRERARLRSERWRRAHGIGPRKPAQRPWLALGISRSTWYRRRASSRAGRKRGGARPAGGQIAELRASLDKIAVANAAMAAVLN